MRCGLRLKYLDFLASLILQRFRCYTVYNLLQSSNSAHRGKNDICLGLGLGLVARFWLLYTAMYL